MPACMCEGIHGIVFLVISLLSFLDCKAGGKAQVTLEEMEL